MKEETSKWLKSGEQSRLSEDVRKVSSQFTGNECKKIMDIINWMNKNLKRCQDQEKVLKIFATRDLTEVLNEKLSTGCHDDALILAGLCRAAGIPAKYIVGIDKLDPRNRGHCVVEVYVNKRWILVDQSRGCIYLDPLKSAFYRTNYIVGKGLDSWDVGIKEFGTWEEKSKQIVEYIKLIESMDADK